MADKWPSQTLRLKGPTKKMEPERGDRGKRTTGVILGPPPSFRPGSIFGNQKNRHRASSGRDGRDVPVLHKKEPVEQRKRWPPGGEKGLGSYSRYYKLANEDMAS